MSWDLNVDNTEMLSTTHFSNNWKLKIITGIIKFSKNIIWEIFLWEIFSRKNDLSKPSKTSLISK